MRVLAIFAAAFSGGTFLARYLLPDNWLLPCAAAAFLFACTRFFLPGKTGRRVLLIGAGLSLSFGWNWLYAQRTAIPAAALSGIQRETVMTLCGYAVPSPYGARVTVRIPGVPGKAVYYGNADLLRLRPGEIVRDIVRFQDASRIREDEITAFTSKGIFLLAYSRGKPAIEAGNPVTEAGGLVAETGTAVTEAGKLDLYAGNAAPFGGIHSPRWYPIRLGRAFREKIQTLLSGDPAAVLSAMLTGDRSGISVQAGADLSETGVTHILAVSGMHCGFLLALITLLSGRQRRRLIAAITIPVLIFYAVLTGGSPPVVRAGIMLSLLVLAPLFRRKADAPTSLFAALFLILLHNPYAAASAGLQLSFASVAGLLRVSPALYTRMTANLERNGDQREEKGDPAGQNGTRTGAGGDQTGKSADRAAAVWKNRMIRFGAASLSASVGALIFTLPLTGLYFGLCPLIAPLSNLLCLWAAGGIFCFGLAAVLCGFLCPPLAALIAVVPDLLIRYLLAAVHTLAKLPLHAVYFANPYLSLWLAYAYLLFAAAYGASRLNFANSLKRTQGKRETSQKSGRPYALASLLALAALALTVLLGQSRYQNAADAVILDVGQGESIVLASGGHFALVDCGSANSWIDAGTRAAQRLGSMGCRRLDALILTHYDSDHVNGAGALLARIGADALYVPEAEEEAGMRPIVLESAQAAGVPVRFLRERTVIPFGNGDLTLFPPLGTAGDNEIGLSVLASAGETDFLITGDMGSKTEQRLIRLYDLPDLEILMAGHHGSRYSTSDELLSALTPEIACISVGSNSYGHPTADTLQRLENHGCAVYRTDLDGDIHLAINWATPLYPMS